MQSWRETSKECFFFLSSAARSIEVTTRMEREEGCTGTHGLALGLVLPGEGVVGAAGHREYLDHRVQCQLYCRVRIRIRVRRHFV